MQTQKAKNGSDVSRRKPSIKPPMARHVKPPGSDSDTISSSPHPATKSPKEKLKVAEHKSPRSPASEKRKPSRVSELESQVTQLQEELKKANEQLNASESLKRQAQSEAEATKKQLLAMSSKLDESTQQLIEFSASEDERIQELRKISQDRDREWQSELEAVRRQHSMDSAALGAAMNEIQKLKLQLDMVALSESTQRKHAESAHAEIQDLKIELEETLSLVENLKGELFDCKESESRALEVLKKTEMQLETANETIKMLKSDGTKAVESINSLSLELKQSEEQVKSLEGLVTKYKKLEDCSGNQNLSSEENEGTETKSESCKRQAELEAELKEVLTQIEQLRAHLLAKETLLQSISKENDMLTSKIEKNVSNEVESDLVEELKKSLLDKETELQSLVEENETFRNEIKNREMEETKDEAVNSEMEGELRRLKVQLEQWRKAAEAATEMLSEGNDNAKYAEKTGLLPFGISYPLGSPYSEDINDDSPKKKNAYMLKKRIGVLWKKGQK